ncbi:MAG: ribonuclease D [Pseudomonadota bacterium]|nr:ribonuclease D [Pseudomonadota bacterium]
MTLISDNSSLLSACDKLSKEVYLGVDTEFMRERTYYPKLCLIQISGEKDAIAVDALSPDINLSPVLKLLYNPNITKVFHACRQDMEIFFNLTKKIHYPVFDTQIAAMVCGYGDAISYDKLVKQIVEIEIDKSSRFTDWSQRPLSNTQLKYALSDVTHLRKVYESLEKQLKANNRETWLLEELGLVTNPNTYIVDPENIWSRLKVRSGRPRFLILVKALASFREQEAQRKDIPRNRVLRDDVLLDIAARAPETPEELAKVRSISTNYAASKSGNEILKTISLARKIPTENAPKIEKRERKNNHSSAIVELLKVLLKMKSEENNVAQKLIAGTADLEAIAEDDMANVPALKGWRREIFGNDALLLKSGKIGLSIYNSSVKISQIN